MDSYQPNAPALMSLFLLELGLQRIGLDPDGGVKLNYGKFGDLLVEVKAVTGGSDED